MTHLLQTFERQNVSNHGVQDNATKLILSHSQFPYKINADSINVDKDKCIVKAYRPVY